MKLRFLPLILVLLITACTSKEQSQVSEILVEDPKPEEQEPAQEIQQMDEAGPDEEDPAEESASVQEEVATEIRVKTALEATDPTTVALGDGQLTFVEFFAFW